MPTIETLQEHVDLAARLVARLRTGQPAFTPALARIRERIAPPALAPGADTGVVPDPLPWPVIPQPELDAMDAEVRGIMAQVQEAMRDQGV